MSLATRLALSATAIAVFGTSAFAQQPKGASTPVPTLAQPSRAIERTPEQCAAAYHLALEPARRERAPALGDLMRKLRVADADLAGKWLFAQQLFQKKPTRQPKPERTCVETKEFREVARCVRFDIKPPPPPPPEIASKLPPGAEDLRLMKTMADFVESRGSVPDVSANGRQTFLVQRLAQDLRLYVSQPATPVLCAGAPELMEFYAGQLVPLKKRLDDLQVLAKKLRETAAARTRDVAVTEVRLYDAAVAAQPSTEGAVSTAAPSAAVAQPLPPKPAAPAALADYAVTSFPAQLAEALRPLLPATLVSEITAEREPMAMFTRSRKALLDPEIKPPTAPSIEVRDAAIAALRLHEARVYADRYVMRYREIDVALSATLANIKSAHGGACTCND